MNPATWKHDGVLAGVIRLELRGHWRRSSVGRWPAMPGKPQWDFVLSAWGPHGIPAALAEAGRFMEHVRR